MAAAGLDTYRFSIEWARIEPVPGQVSRAELEHYRRMVEGCLDRGLTPVVTLHHFTSPAWFRAAGGWAEPDAPGLFRRYVRAVLPVLDGVTWICTINEPNMVALMHAVLRDGVHPGTSGADARTLPPPDQATADGLLHAHAEARGELAALSGARTGWSVANQDFQPQQSDDPEVAERVAQTLADWAWPREEQYLVASKDDDFVGVQSYTRTVVGPEGPVPPAPDAPRTLTGWEVYPEALGHAVRHTASVVGDVPILITENGIATDDDEARIAYTRDALAGVEAALADGVDVRGYLHWSLLDNYEWGSWRPRFGLVEVDRESFVRTPKPSLAWLGERARTARGASATVA